MVAERQVGRGRVVVSSFPLREPRIMKWRYFSSFLSTALLRRPARTITNTAEGIREQKWAAPYYSLTNDPRMHSNLRILSRDLPVSKTIYDSQSQSAEQIEKLSQQITSASVSDLELNAPAKSEKQDLESMRWGGNGAAWNDYSGLAYQTQTALAQSGWD